VHTLLCDHTAVAIIGDEIADCAPAFIQAREHDHVETALF
jgi:hypothetical protein